MILCHPHPLYGGNMFNNVINALVGGFISVGFSTLRFNFRGVGRSSGRFGQGIGERKDLDGAYRYMKASLRPDSRLILCGYSFGAEVVVSYALESGGTLPLLLISYPLVMADGTMLASYPGEIYLVVGDRDEYSPLEEISSIYRQLKNPRGLHVIETNHFYFGREKELGRYVIETFSVSSSGG